MNTLAIAISALKSKRDKLQAQIDPLNLAIEALGGTSAAPAKGKRRRGTMSAAGRKAVGDASRARWAAKREAAGGDGVAVATPAPVAKRVSKPRLSQGPPKQKGAPLAVAAAK